MDKDIPFRIRQRIGGIRECFQRVACRSDVQNSCKFRKSLQKGNPKFFRETKIASSDFRPCRWQKMCVPFGEEHILSAYNFDGEVIFQTLVALYVYTHTHVYITYIHTHVCYIHVCMSLTLSNRKIIHS